MEEQKPEHNNIWNALSAFQGELKPIPQNGKVDFITKKDNTHVKYSYATLGDIMQTIYPILGKHGLSVRHSIVGSEIECIVSWNDTNVSSGKLLIDVKNPDMKEIAGQITYAKRYTLAMVLGLATEEDKDAEMVEKRSEASNSFVYKTIKSTLEKSKSLEYIEKQITVLANEIVNPDPKVGLDADQCKELLEIAKNKREELATDKSSEDLTGNQGK